MAEMRQPIESGAPDPKPYMHPTMVKNYGKWIYHSHPKPGVLFHEAESGDKIWTVKAGTQRQMDGYTIRKLADIADQFADGFVRFTTRSNIEEGVFTLQCEFVSACGRYAFWRLTNNQAPEAQYLIETAHIPNAELREAEFHAASDLVRHEPESMMWSHSSPEEEHETPSFTERISAFFCRMFRLS